MNCLSDWLSHIESFHPEEIELGLERVKDVALRLRLLEHDARVIIVGGTNGKGSCVATLESLAIEAGIKVASYTSPHLLCFNERIRLNQKNVTDDQLIEAFSVIEASRGDTALTFFEYTTLAALQVFKQRQLDLIVLEVGLGGRLDAVNIVEPDVSVITTVDRDHESWLGSDLAQIAKEKSGIYRTGKNNLIGDIRSAELMSATLPNNQFEIKLAKKQLAECIDERVLKDVLNNYELNSFRLLEQNIECALAAFYQLFPHESQNTSIANVVSRIKLRGRFEKISNNPITYIDVGHNVQSARNLANQIKRLHHQGPVYAICGLMADKATGEFVNTMDKVIDHWYFVDLPGERAASAEQLLAEYQETSKQALESSESNLVNSERNKAQIASNVRDAHQFISQNSPENSLVFVVGSFITVSEILLNTDENC